MAQVSIVDRNEDFGNLIRIKNGKRGHIYYWDGTYSLSDYYMGLYFSDTCVVKRRAEYRQRSLRKFLTERASLLRLKEAKRWLAI